MRIVIRIFLILFILLPVHSLLIAQECGPNCPLCSGSGSTTGTLLAKGVLLGNLLVVPDGEETLIPSVKFALHDRIDVGLGYINKSENIIWNARALLVAEKENRPGVIAGSGSVRIGGADQSVFLTATKNIEDNTGIPLRFSAGAAAVTSDLDKLYFIGTVSYLYKEKLFPFVTYDGTNTHFGMSYLFSANFSLGLLYIEGKYFGIAPNIRFNLN